jgi:hypothetical protein
MVPEPLGLKSEDQAWLTFASLSACVTGDGDEEIRVARGWLAPPLAPPPPVVPAVEPPAAPPRPDAPAVPPRCRPAAAA